MHYSKAQSPRKLIVWAREAAADLKRYDDDGFDIVLVYTGMSGVASATALMAEYFNLTSKDLKCVYVRKEGEKSHGSAVESNCTTKLDKTNPKNMILFVDDFICSGETTARVIHKLSNHYWFKIDFDEMLKLVYLSLSGHNTEVDYEPIVKLEDSKFFNRVITQEE